MILLLLATQDPAVLLERVEAVVRNAPSLRVRFSGAVEAKGFATPYRGELFLKNGGFARFWIVQGTSSFAARADGVKVSGEGRIDAPEKLHDFFRAHLTRGGLYAAFLGLRDAEMALDLGALDDLEAPNEAQLRYRLSDGYRARLQLDPKTSLPKKLSWTWDKDRIRAVNETYDELSTVDIPEEVFKK